jgi:hypothetical protein
MSELTDEEKANLLEIANKRWAEGRERCARNLDIQRAEAKHSRRMRALFDNPKLHGRI